MSDVKAIIADLAERMESTSYKWMSVQRSLLRALIDHVKAVEAERDTWAAQALKEDDCRIMWQVRAEAAERQRDEQSSRIADLERQLAEARLSAQTIGDELGNQINRLLADRAEARKAAMEAVTRLTRYEPSCPCGEPTMSANVYGEYFYIDDVLSALSEDGKPE